MNSAFERGLMEGANINSTPFCCALFAAPYLPEALRRWGSSRDCDASPPFPNPHGEQLLWKHTCFSFLHRWPRPLSWWYFFHCHLLYFPVSLVILRPYTSPSFNYFSSIYLLTVLPLPPPPAPLFGIDSLLFWDSDRSFSFLIFFFLFFFPHGGVFTFTAVLFLIYFSILLYCPFLLFLFLIFFALLPSSFLCC